MAAGKQLPQQTPTAIRWLVGGLLLLLLVLQIPLWLGEGSFRDVRLLHQAMDQQEYENAALRARNDALAAEVDNLKAGTGAVEERARTDLGMIREGETFYHVLPAGGEGDTGAAQQR